MTVHEAEKRVEACLAEDKANDLQWRFSDKTKRAWRALDKARDNAERDRADKAP